MELYLTDCHKTWYKRNATKPIIFNFLCLRNESSDLENIAKSLR
jgi:hypothetical protein